MAVRSRIRVQRLLREAEGYLELCMPAQALAALDRIEQPGTFRGQWLFFRGEALRAQEQYDRAIEPLALSADLLPSNLQVWLALGWCYKRTGKLNAAIESLEQALEVEPDDPLVQYNLACYHSLRGEARRALAYLSQAISANPSFRDLVADEPDFDPLRSDPEFKSLTSVVV